MKLPSTCTAAIAVLLLFSPGLATQAIAQTGAITSAQADTMARGNVLASLTRTINSKKVKVGDKVTLKTMGSVTLSDGTNLPRGTALTGAITAVEKPEGHDKTASVSFTLDTANVHGKTIPVHVLVTAAKVPNLILNADGRPITSDMTRGNIMPDAGAGMAQDRQMMQSVESQETGANSVKHKQVTNSGTIRIQGSTLQIIGVPVISLKGATLSSTTAGKGEATFQNKKDVDMENGTQMRLYVAPAQ